MVDSAQARRVRVSLGSMISSTAPVRAAARAERCSTAYSSASAPAFPHRGRARRQRPAVHDADGLLGAHDPSSARFHAR